jgi:AAA+ ATPase superfamily predicted ATPase
LLSATDSIVDRREQLEDLRALCELRRPSLALLYGRRRVGKTYLLRHAFGGRRCLYFLAADTTHAINRADLLIEVAGLAGRSLDPSDFPTWRTIFRLFGELALAAPLTVVLDEFQYLMGGPDAWFRDSIRSLA